ncbi:MAG: RDD family protein, partial [Chlamydiia bacterium]|nr:RDD family protein [Chlamydiia bacterium]
PWVRFLARFFDYSLWLALLWVIRFFFFKAGAAKGDRTLVPWEFFVFLPIEAFFLSVWGKTVGKYFLKIGIRQGRRTKLSLISSLRRSLNVWFRGIGMMIPFLNFVCLLIAYYRLQSTKTTSWDRDEGIVVTYHPIGQWRLIFAAVFSSCIFFLYWN